MTPLVKRQLLQALHPHYRSAAKVEKATLLDAFNKATGYNRKYTITLLHQGGPAKRRPRRPGRSRYDGQVVEALRRLWEALRPFLAPLLEALERRGELTLAPVVKAALLRMSPATIDRKLAPSRRRLKPRGLTTTRPGAS